MAALALSCAGPGAAQDAPVVPARELIEALSAPVAPRAGETEVRTRSLGAVTRGVAGTRASAATPDPRRDAPRASAPKASAPKEGAPREAPTRALSLDILFERGSASLLGESHAQLVEVGRALREIGRRDPGATFVVEGHTDATGARDANLRLSERRARTIGDYLTQRFDIAPERLRLVGRGEAEPVADNATERGRRLNRRVVVARGDR